MTKSNIAINSAGISFLKMQNMKVSYCELYQNIVSPDFRSFEAHCAHIPRQIDIPQPTELLNPHPDLMKLTETCQK